MGYTETVLSNVTPSLLVLSLASSWVWEWIEEQSSEEVDEMEMLDGEGWRS